MRFALRKLKCRYWKVCGDARSDIVAQGKTEGGFKAYKACIEKYNGKADSSAAALNKHGCHHACKKAYEGFCP